MGIFGKLFATKTPSRNPYLEAGAEFTSEIVRDLQLPGWNNHSPVYTHVEEKAIDQKMSEFQDMANEVGGGDMMFHPEFAREMQQRLMGEALESLASDNMNYCREPEPADVWKARASTYLKAWASTFNPRMLIDLATFLLHKRHPQEAKKALQVVLQFPTYAPSYLKAASAPEILNAIMSDANEVLGWCEQPLT